MIKGVLVCALALCVSCGGGGKPDSRLTGGAVQALPADTAIMAGEAGLVALGAGGEVSRRWAQQGVVWCATDARSGLVWTLTADDAGVGTLWAITLSGAQAPMKVASGLPPTAVEIVYPDGQRVAELDDADFDVGTTLDLSAMRLSGRIGCGNAMSADICYEMDAAGLKVGPDGKEVLVPELEAQRAQADAAKLVDAAALAALTNGNSGPLWTSLKPEVLAPIAGLDLSGQPCDGAETCGEVLALTNTPYALVTTSSSFGDLPHNERQHYNPALRGFFDPRDPSAVSATILTDEEAILYDARLVVAPGGGRYLAQGRLVVFGRGAVSGEALQLGCGFAGASALIPVR